MLAATLFTTLLKQHLSCPFNSTVLSFQSVNLELIKRQQDHPSYTLPYTNTTLTDEFDLTEMIHVLQQDQNLPSNFCHVKGHQDRHKAYADLDLCTQLNVEADQLAAAYTTILMLRRRYINTLKAWLQKRSTQMQASSTPFAVPYLIGLTTVESTPASTWNNITKLYYNKPA